jgi:hypothetical protein
MPRVVGGDAPAFSQRPRPVRRRGGRHPISDTCPSEEVFAAFSGGDGFGAALAEAGLARPSITGRPVNAARVASA